MNQETQTLQGIIGKQTRAKNALKMLELEFNNRSQALRNEINELQRLRDNAANGLDLDKITLAETLVEVRGTPDSFERRDVVEDAIADIANGAPTLRREYFGAKNYEGWVNQRSDHTYGYGPRHGIIVFAVGLTEHARDTIRDGHGLEPAEIEACLYYLEALKQGKLVRGDQS